MRISAGLSAISIENLVEPSMIVDIQGRVQAFNRQTLWIFVPEANVSSILDYCPDESAALRIYLDHCSRSRQPHISKFTFACREGAAKYRCAGNLLSPKAKNKPATILLRFLPAIDARFTAGAERIKRLADKRKWQFVASRSKELHEDRLRLVEQYLFTADALRFVEDQKHELQDEVRRTQAAERERIAQDIHDQAGQELSTLIVELRGMRDRARGCQRTRLDVMVAQISDIGRRLRQAVIGARPRLVEEFGLKRAIELTTESYAADSGLQFSFRSIGKEAKSLSMAIESAIYRIAQEALTNIVKHAHGAVQIDVRLAFTAKSISLAVADDGIGFSLAPHAWLGGAGICGMQQRMASVGGVLQVDSAPGRGTTISASAPLLVANETLDAR